MLVTNISVVLTGAVNNKEKKPPRKIVEELGPGALICTDTLLDKNDIHYKNVKLL